MDHREQHHQHHQKERELEKMREREHERQLEKSSRPWGPHWFVMAGIVLVALAIVVWVAFF
jgi:hypothetical protein